MRRRWRLGVHLFAAQVRLHARDQFARAEGLGHVVVAADFQSQDAIHLVGPRRQEQHRRARQHRGVPDLAAQLKAVQIGQHDVQQDQIGLGLLQRAQGAFRAAEQLRLIPMADEVVLDQRGKLRFILHDGNFFRHGTCLP